MGRKRRERKESEQIVGICEFCVKLTCDRSKFETVQR